MLLAVLLLAGLAGSGCAGKTAAGPQAGQANQTPALGPAGATTGVVAPTAAAPTVEVAPSPTPTPPAPLAATVNGRYIFLADYERRVAQYQEALIAQGVDAKSQEGQARLAEMRQEVLDSLINYALIELKAAQVGVTLTDQEIESQVTADIQAGGGQAAFDEWLKATGQTRDDYKQSLREAMLWQRVMDAVTANVPTTAEQVHVRHIVVDTREAADRVLAQLQGGTDFAQVARTSSLDVATKDNGGDMGWLPRGLADPDLEATVFALQPGEIAGPIDFAQGFRFVQVVERDAARAVPAEMQADLKRALFERWLEEQRAAAQIERFVEK